MLLQYQMDKVMLVSSDFGTSLMSLLFLVLLFRNDFPLKRTPKSELVPSHIRYVEYGNGNASSFPCAMVVLFCLLVFAIFDMNILLVCSL